VRGNGGDPSTLFFHVPDGIRLAAATLHGSAVSSRQPQADVLAVDIPALADWATLVLSFSGDSGKTKPRPFVPGRAATRFDR
jgi:hypothetical protein